MIVVRDLEGRYAPRLLCDVCEQPITDGKMAAVVFGRPAEAGAGVTLHPLAQRRIRKGCPEQHGFSDFAGGHDRQAPNKVVAS